MKIVKQPLPTNCYYAEECEKTQIVLHHPESSTATSPINWWKQQQDGVATPYVVDKDGTIYEVFDPAYWAWHLGKYANIKYNKRFNYNKSSIGIEIVNEGYLTRDGGDYKWSFGKFNGSVYEVKRLPWRSYKWFAAYKQPQVVAVAELIKILCKRFHIPEKVYGKFDFNLDLLDYKGVISHCNVHDGKTDISPAFPLKELSSMAFPQLILEGPQRATKCPLCKEDALEYGEEHKIISRKFYIANWACSNCGNTGTAEYSMEFKRHILQSKGDVDVKNSG